MVTTSESFSLPPTTAPSQVISSPMHDDSDSFSTSCLSSTSFHVARLECPPPASQSSSAHKHGGGSISVDEACRRSLPHFPSPSLAFPMPLLDFDFRVAVSLNPEPSHIEARVKKEVATISCGTWSGSFGNGRVVAGGYDLGQARGFRPIRFIEGAYILQTSDESPAPLELRTRGSLSGPCSLLDGLLGPRQPKDVDPRQYSFRMFATVKTPDKRYADLVNCGLWVASGVWHGTQLIIE
ncbi:hypothetical protein CDD81_838 [Ophiocordyceps australis]|uniref:Uncharacterized protein n=1 Tax=Ophiocordyceps australis TaxID=1399860 RepID=A0A2C5Y018_9HYPO|nr:hypothetical protein CDD81_838 [Ophiocordyceps australis]